MAQKNPNTHISAFGNSLQKSQYRELVSKLILGLFIHGKYTNMTIFVLTVDLCLSPSLSLECDVICELLRCSAVNFILKQYHQKHHSLHHTTGNYKSIRYSRHKQGLFMKNVSLSLKIISIDIHTKSSSQKACKYIPSCS